MSTPIKSVSSLLLHSKKASPIVAKLQSPLGNKSLDNKKNIYFKTPKNNICECNTINSNVPQVKVTECAHIQPASEDSLMINSPNKLNLLKHGLNRYDLLYFIGKGSFGTVVKGKHEGNLVAVKVIKLQNSTDKDKINEYNALNLAHENVIKTIDVIINNNEKYGLILMEYHKNSRNLQTILNDTNFSLNRSTIVSFAKDVVSGVKYCHENKILHLDIKPKNILLCNNKCKICDFGNSVQESDATPVINYKGTIAYTAPEILKGKKPTVKSDVFSLGILFWQMICRKFPYESLDNEVIIYKVVKFNFRPDLSELKNNEDFSKLCCICWEGNPTDRPTAPEVFDILNAFKC